MFNNFPPPPENHTVYEIMWKNTVKPDTPQVTKLLMRISDYKNALGMCKAYYFSTATISARTHLNVTF